MADNKVVFQVKIHKLGMPDTLVDAIAEQRRMFGPDLCILVKTKDGRNSMWMPVKDEYLVISPEERAKIKYLPWWGQK